MATKAVGGGSSAVAASSHAACERFRGTDPLITGRTRHRLAREIGFQDKNGGITEARWMRAVTFERLVRDEQFASKVATLTVGRLGLERPTAVVIANARTKADRTAELLEKAHERAVRDRAATMLHGLALPFVGFEDASTTDVKPDFAVVAPMPADEDEPGSWLVMGDAKDYERHRSKIEDSRLLKGFLQVALGAESAAQWSKLPAGMLVHTYGVLAVPRNAFLQPEPLVEDLTDHREEVRMRVLERRAEAKKVAYDESKQLVDHIRHLRATYDPRTCSTCTLFKFCRHELRQSSDPMDLLIEIGVPVMERPHVIGLVDGTGDVGRPSESVKAQVLATIAGRAQPTGQRRIDPIGLPGTINLVMAKSDSAALGVYGIALQRVTANGPLDWKPICFDDAQTPESRRSIMKLIGKEVSAAMAEARKVNANAPTPVHLVVPDKATADVLVSIADNLAGIELQRLRWAHDKEMGRNPLTFDGEPAVLPKSLNEYERTGISFLLEEDRARTFRLRSPIVDLREALARHVVAGGPAVNSLRLDYLAAWAAAEDEVDHVALSDEVEDEESTPGARLANDRSNAIHKAFTGDVSGYERPAHPEEYRALVLAELDYKMFVVDRAVAALDRFDVSNLREVHRAIEGDAQEVWRRRLSLHASDLVRFGRTYRHWRNSLVPSIESDDKCFRQLMVLENPQAAVDAALDAGMRDVVLATVVSTDPIVLEIGSRRIGHEDRVVLLHRNGVAAVEAADVSVTAQKGSFKFDQMSIGPLAELAGFPHHFEWAPHFEPELEVGDQLVIARFPWFGDQKGNRFLPLARPTVDTVSAPKPDCTDTSYADDPHHHQWCCRPHENSEAEWADVLAGRRARGELNPEVWPPVVDEDSFEVSPSGAPVGDPTATPAEPVPDDVTIDDLE